MVPLSDRAAHDSSFADVLPDASPDASLHLSTPTFPRNLGIWRCFVAATDSPCWGSLLRCLCGQGWPLSSGCLASAQAGGGVGWGVALRHTCLANFAARAASSPISGRLHFVILRTGLFASSERQWKETVGHEGWYVQTNGMAKGGRI